MACPVTLDAHVRLGIPAAIEISIEEFRSSSSTVEYGLVAEYVIIYTSLESDGPSPNFSAPTQEGFGIREREREGERSSLQACDNRLP